MATAVGALLAAGLVSPMATPSAVADALASSSSPASAAAPAAPEANELLAISGADFDPGYIISDELFYDGNAMTQAEIQAFLDAKIGACQNGLCLNVVRVSSISRGADSYCNGYTGSSSESTAAIIFKTQQSCSISAKVLLVLLQKEQGLITHTSPSQSRLDRATGYACSDTAPCAVTTLGLANQIYKAAWQFQAYRISSSFRWYPVGQVSNVLFHPDAARCGSAPVLIRNWATAGLYYYTPYQPNGAALANLGGTGDTCSSYGNRNFFVFWSNWFGSPTKSGPDYLNEFRAANSWLGAQSGPAELVQGSGSMGYRQSFQAGTLYWTSTLGVQVLTGVQLAKYTQIGGPSSQLGWPSGAQIQTSVAGVDGSYQYFQNGTMYWSAVGGAHAVTAGILSAYREAGTASGPFGWPIADQTCASGTSLCAQKFESGTLFGIGATGVRLTPVTQAAWSASGGLDGALGYPTSIAIETSAGGLDGSFQYFQRGTVYETNAYGAYAVAGPMLKAYQARATVSGPLGWPTDVMTCAAGGALCAQRFQHDVLYLNGEAEFSLSSAVAAASAAAGGLTGPLGFPLAAAVSTSANGLSGTYQYFQGGTVYATDARGAYAVTGDLLAAYRERATVSGLGWPTDNAICGGSGCRQDFQEGTLYVTGGTSYVLNGVMEAYYQSIGGAGSVLGVPVGAVVSTSAQGVPGAYQYFAGGTVYWTASTGAHAVTGAMLTAYRAASTVSGSYGWPKGEMSCDAAGACSQAFQGGTLSVTPGAQQVMEAYYQSIGGAGSVLGVPVGAVVSTSAQGVPGAYQYFAGGTVYWTASTGAHAVTGAMLTAYRAASTVSGSYGWPKGEMSCDAAGACSQAFQGGTLSVTPGAQQVMEAYYQSIGGAGSVLGVPVGAVVSTSAQGVPGAYQYFAGGTVYWTASTGAHAVTGAMLTAYRAASTVSGSYGWPKGEMSCDAAGACSQAFQGGTLSVTPGAQQVMEAYYQSIGGAGSVLGVPVGAVVSTSAQGVPGAYQYFAGGTVYWTASTGAHAVTGAMLTAYRAASTVSGSYGWPKGEMSCDAAGACSQAFQGGTLSVTPGAQQVMEAYYQSIGGAGSVLGVPVGAVVSTSAQGVPGAYQYFAGGTVYWTASTGAHAVTGAMLTAYRAASTVSGSYGWPKGEMSCDAAGACSQAFQGGTLSVTPGA
ncbi:hypothetical protein [Protaetiibacter intestinalis]|uniref:hypothetical protein n=1 Tax=Protaetiibacter intestinalis TaxID=2419774 RepID=UPI0013009B29|nr:hypothetical protein [Protaetiibacter intestinalis]